MVLTAEQADRARGVLLGTAAGDALGAGYEFTHPKPDVVIRMKGGGAFDWAPGEWTDDTAMAIAVARAAAEAGNLHEESGLDAVAREFVAWWDTRPKDVGAQTSQVLRHRDLSGREMQIHAHELGGLKAGNGSLMRTAPVALVYLDDEPIKCAKAAAVVSSLTHYDPQAMQACKIWSLAIRHAVLHGTYDGVREALSIVDAGFWGPLLDTAEHGAPEDFPKNGWVVHALQTAWWAITHTDSLPAALEAAVRAGGDTDTTAAIAGGLLGARWGASAIPAEWLELLHGYPGYRADDLDKLTERILER
ncbi:ADP-ribosylglycohydrolase family protein [Nocardia yamanashiensis]|uniref:ADP-ribosylglycohydrolase family protein n=1 Tax=Nocardia yamanashiensis TaxID=209247 RepID=UPI001E2CF0EC|nr:ADP-ribosylglycohydrolase family protein [Nocardia yamanashiensis]UGT41048.1 ADP-ribosylglycohydrolase family protein [Nocardia yamanashiensis]